MAEYDDLPDRDPFAEYDAAYVFGALSASERTAYENHLTTCARCRADVAAIAGLPGLLSPVPVEQIGLASVEDVPPSLLPRLLSAARTQRRRLRTGTAITAGLLAACVVALLVVVLRSEQNERPVAAPTTVAVDSTVPIIAQLPMRVVGVTDLRATVGLQAVAWGTRIDLRCTYPASTSSSAIDPTDEYANTSYEMVVVSRVGAAAVVATWNAVSGKTIRVDAASKLSATTIARVEITDAKGRVLLDLTR